MTDAKETIIKSALKYLVKRQIEEGSVGFAVDNDPDHDCCWDDVLAWIEAQPTDITWVVGNDGAQVAFKNMPVDKAQQICAIIGDEAQSTDADSSEFDKGEISDGYHTFNQLYHQRAILFATIVNQNKDKAWKSFKHSDGHYCFDEGGEMFIVGIDTPEGSYTYHYHKKYWDYFDCKELEYGKVWDGHTEEDVTRLLSLDQQPCRNCISRESVIEWLKDKDIIKTKNQEENVRRELAELPSVTPSYSSIKTELKPCKDCISREHAKQFLYYEIERLHDDGLYDCFSRIIDDMYNELPSVTPKYTDEEIDRAQAVEQAYVDKMVELAVEESKRPKGRWIKCKSRFGVEYFKCSECGRRLDWIDRDDNYCSNCGSDNSESTKKWVKERDTKVAEMSGGDEDENSN